MTWSHGNAQSTMLPKKSNGTAGLALLLQFTATALTWVNSSGLRSRAAAIFFPHVCGTSSPASGCPVE